MKNLLICKNSCIFAQIYELETIIMNLLRQLHGIKMVTREEIIANIDDKKPKRICFNTTPQNGCHRVKIPNNTAVGAINVPFDESIKLFIRDETGLELIPTSSGRFWCPANSEEEYQKLEAFCAKYRNAVFIRDTLECSIAISEHISEENRTEIGELYRRAKYDKSEDAINALSKTIVDFISNAGVYKELAHICAIPSSKKGEKNLPQKIAHSICQTIEKTDVSSFVEWKNEKQQLKELNVNKKLEALELVNLNINFDIKDKNIILIDDLYQSGITMQYVAMKLKEHGASKIYGIAIVKSRKNTDNSV